MIRKMLISLVISLFFFVSNVYANVFYEVSFVLGAAPIDVFNIGYIYHNNTGIRGQGFYEIPMKYGLSSITPVIGKENVHILQFSNSSEPLYLGELLKTNEYILKVRLLKDNDVS